MVYAINNSFEKKGFSIDTNRGQKRKKNYGRKLCQILHCGNDTAIVKWTEYISSKTNDQGRRNSCFFVLYFVDLKKNKTGINRENFV